MKRKDFIKHLEKSGCELLQPYRFVDSSFWQMPSSSYTISNLWDE